ncbi:MAG: hypothetical protein IPO34_15895 [Dehalococcoidia bacterium]|nr:hypothetical protein [Dehalococcoidia bacterium]
MSVAASTLQLEIPVVLPHIEDERDQGVGRLTEPIAARKKIQQVSYIERQNGQALVCLALRSQSAVAGSRKSLPGRAGAQITDRFHHIHLPIAGWTALTG